MSCKSKEYPFSPESFQLAVIHRQVQAVIDSEDQSETALADLKPDQQVAALVPMDANKKSNKTWVRATVEQKGMGPKLKVKAMDIGSTFLVGSGECRPLPEPVTRQSFELGRLSSKLKRDRLFGNFLSKGNRVFLSAN